MQQNRQGLRERTLILIRVVGGPSNPVAIRSRFRICVSRVVFILKRSRACVSKTLAAWADEYGTGSDSDRRQFH